MSRGTRYRIPRRVKKALANLHAGRVLTTRDLHLCARCVFMTRRAPGTYPRRGNAHVAMGDTTTCRRRERHGL